MSDTNIRRRFYLKLNQSTKTAWLVMFMDFFHYIAFMCTKPYLKSLLSLAGASNTVAGVILALFSLVQVINSVFLSKWIQKKGQKPQLVMGAFIYMFAGLILAFAPMVSGSSDTLETVLVAISVVLLGTSHGIFLLAGHYVITGLPKEEGRDAYVGYLTFINSIGQFVGPLIAAALLAEPLMNAFKNIRIFDAIAQKNGYVYVLLFSVISSGISLLLACIIRNVRGDIKKKPAKFGTVLKDKALMKIVLINAAVYFSTDVVVSYTQEFGEKTLMLSAATATMIMTAMKFSAIFVRAFLGWLTKHIGSAKLLRLTLLFIGLAIFCMGLTNTITAGLANLGLPEMTTKVVIIMTLALIYGLANGLVNPLALIELSNASDDTNRSPALALRNMANSGGQTFGEVALGFIIEATSTLSPVFLLSGTILFGCYLLSFDRKKKSPVPSNKE